MINPLAQRSYVIERGEILTSSDFPTIEVFDQLFFDGRDADVKSLRELLKQFYQQPSGSIRLLAINHAEALKELLQNTLLKTIEEPPSRGTVVIQTRSVDSLLPTVRSRLQKLSSVTVRSKPSLENLDINKLYGLDRQALLAELETTIDGLDLATSSNLNRHYLLDQSVRRLRQNVNIKLTLDWLGLNWNRESSKE